MGERDATDQLLFELVREIQRHRSQGSLSAIQETRTRAESIKPLTELHEAVLRAAIGECEAIEGRWTGNQSMIEAGVQDVRLLLGLLESGRLGEVAVEARIQALAWLGNNLARLGYQSRQAVHLAESVDRLQEAIVLAFLRQEEDGERRLFIEGALRARDGKTRTEYLIEGVDRLSKALGTPNAIEVESEAEAVGIDQMAAMLRDLGDAYVGQLIWDDNVEIDGGAVRVLRVSARLFERLLDSRRMKHVAKMEVPAVKSSLALACLFIVEAMSSTVKGARPTEAFLLSGECDGYVVEARRAILDSIRLLSDTDGEFRPARSFSNLGFAAHLLWRQDGSEQSLRWARRSFRSSLNMYCETSHRYRHAVTREGLANLYRDRMLRAMGSRRRVLGGASMRLYRSAAAAFLACGSARSEECNRKRVFVLRSMADQGLHKVVDLWHPYDGAYNPTEAEIVDSIFNAAASTLERGREMVARAVEAEIHEEQSRPRMAAEERQAFRDHINALMEKAALAFKVSEERVDRKTGVRHRVELFGDRLRVPTGGALEVRVARSNRGLRSCEIEVIKREDVPDENPRIIEPASDAAADDAQVTPS